LYQISQLSAHPLLSYGDLTVFQNGVHLPYWICYVHVWTTDNKHLVVFITVQGWNQCGNFDNMQVLIFHESGLKIPIQAPNEGFWEILPH